MAYSTVQEILDHAREEAEGMQGTNGVMLFDVSGEGGGKWTATIRDGSVTLEEGETAEPDTTFSMSARDFIDIANGDLNPVSAFMQGKVKVKGDMALALQLQSILA